MMNFKRNLMRLFILKLANAKLAITQLATAQIWLIIELNLR